MSQQGDAVGAPGSDMHGGAEPLRDLRVSGGIRTILGVKGPGRDRVVVRELELSTARPWSWHWLTRELDVISSSTLPHHVPTTMTWAGEDLAVFTRPYVIGRDILEWAAHEPRPSFTSQLHLIRELFLALANLHQIGVAHGGLKPANIMVLDESEHLVLLDAGVTRTQLNADRPNLDELDTRYLPPSRRDSGPQGGGFLADIFAAGWVALESIAHFNNAASVLRATPRERSLNQAALGQLLDRVGVPASVHPVFLKLLSLDPQHRFETADDVLAALELAPVDSSAENGDSPPRASAPGAGAYVDPPLIGRSEELDDLRERVVSALKGEGATVSVCGDSGIGKSRLLDAVAAHAETMGVTVLRGGGFDHTAQRPLGLFTGVLRNLVAYLKANPVEADRVAREIGDLLSPAIELVPGLAEALASRPRPERENREHADGSTVSVAVARLISAVFTQPHPGLLILDDCQLADDLSWQVLEKLATHICSTSGPPAHLSLIVASRPEALAQMRGWNLNDVHFVNLQPLSASNTNELVRAIDAAMPHEVLKYIMSQSSGNPLETLSILRALIESSGLVVSNGRWVADPTKMMVLLKGHQGRDTRGGDRQDFVAARLDYLSCEAQQLIRQGAILGRQFSTELLSLATGLGPAAVHHLLSKAVERRVLRCWEGGEETVYEFSHDRVRDAVMRPLPESTRRDLHQAAARALQEASAAASDFEVAFHLRRAGDTGAALPFALRAGEAGLRQSALDVANANFKIARAALDVLETVDLGDRFRIYEGLGTVQMLLGEYDVAELHLSSAQVLAADMAGLESARLAMLRAELAFKTGRLDEAARWMRRALEELGLRLPTSHGTAWCASLSELLRVPWAITTSRLRRGRTPYAEERSWLAARIYNRIVYEWWFVRSPIWLALGMLRAVRHSFTSGSARERSQVYSSAGVCIAGLVPVLAPLALRFVNRSLRLRASVHDEWGKAQSQHFRGFVLHAGGQWEQATTALDLAIDAFEVFGDRWELNAARWQKALCYFRQGKLHDAGVLARETYWEAKRSGDRIGAGTSLAIWVRCLPSDVKSETISRELWQTTPDDHHTTAMLHAALGWRLMSFGRHEEAEEAFRKADRSLGRPGIRNHFVAQIHTSHLAGLRLRHEATHEWWAGERRERYKSMRRHLLGSVFLSIIFRAERPAVLRECSLQSLARGHRRRGRMLLAAAARSAARASAHGDLAACAYVAERASLTTRRGVLSRLPDAATVCRELGLRVDRGIVESVPMRTLPSEGEPSQHQALLDAVASLVATTHIPEVMHKLCSAISATTSAREVEIVPVLAGARPVVAGGAVDSREREALAKYVVASGTAPHMVLAKFPMGDATEHESTIEVLTALAAAVIEREGLRKESVEHIVAVQEAERDRIARDLHDEFGHLFASMMDRLGFLERSADETSRGAIADLREITRRGVDAVRAVAWVLRPSGLDDLGLQGSVEQFVEDCRQRLPIRISFTTSGPDRSIPPFVETALYRIVQEALTNIGRHSHASEASVLLVFTDDLVRVVVEDDGVGFDLDLAKQARSLGMVGMRERARMVDAELTIQSSPGQGSIVRVEVPLRDG
jgi:two-component system sensor kinase